jgi:hypothetical protein
MNPATSAASHSVSVIGSKLNASLSAGMIWSKIVRTLAMLESFSGSRVGSQRRQPPGDAWPHRARVVAGKQPIGRRLASPGDCSSLYGMQEVRGSIRLAPLPVQWNNSNAHRTSPHFHRSPVRHPVTLAFGIKAQVNGVDACSAALKVTSCTVGKCWSMTVTFEQFRASFSIRKIQREPIWEPSTSPVVGELKHRAARSLHGHPPLPARARGQRRPRRVPRR